MNRKQLSQMGKVSVTKRDSNIVRHIRTSRYTTNQVHTRLTCNINEPEVFNSDYLNHGYCRAFNNNFND